MQKQKVVLIDAHALIHRAYHGLPPLTTSSGLPIQAVYGFVKILLRVFKELKPDYTAIAFDSKTPTFRHLEYKDYKSTRPPAPDDLKKQFPIVREIVQDFSLPLFAIDGYEADDILGFLVDRFEEKLKEGEIYIVTGDWDTAQLVDDRVKIYALKKRIETTEIYSEKNIKDKFHLNPSQIVDFKALKGDPSDNIPGIKGIGEKTAIYLLQKYGDLDTIYDNLDKIEPKYRKKLEQDKENAYLSRSLATISREVPLKFNLKKCAWRGWSEDKVLPILEKYEFRSLINSFSQQEEKNDPSGSLNKKKKEKSKENNEQLTLV